MADLDALRVELGDILADAAEDDPDVGALLAVMTAANPDDSDAEILARYVIGRLAAQGWQVSRDGGRGECGHVVLVGDGHRRELYQCTLPVGHEPARQHHCGDTVEVGLPGSWTCPASCNGKRAHYADAYGVVMTP